MAENIAESYNCIGLAVISGIGVTGYYKKLGFRQAKHYLIKYIDYTVDDDLIDMLVCLLVFAIASFACFIWYSAYNI